VTPGRSLRGSGYGAVARRKKVRFSAEQRYWLGAVKLPWEGRFLPEQGGQGYDSTEMSIEDAVSSRGGWRKENPTLPTIVCVYDPSSSVHMTDLLKVSEDRKFVSAARYFHLVRVDVRSIRDDGRWGGLKRAAFLVFGRDGKPAGIVRVAEGYRAFRAPFERVFRADFRRSADQAVRDMGAVLARRAWVEAEIEQQAGMLCDPISGELRPRVRDRIAVRKAELRSLKQHEAKLLESPRERESEAR